MTDEVFQCEECNKFCDAAGNWLPIPNSRRALELLDMQFEGRTQPVKCVLCREGLQRAAHSVPKIPELPAAPKSKARKPFRLNSPLPPSDR